MGDPYAPPGQPPTAPLPPCTPYPGETAQHAPNVEAPEPGYPCPSLLAGALISIAEAIVPTLGLYRTVATGMFYLACLSPLLTWPLTSSSLLA